MSDPDDDELRDPRTRTTLELDPMDVHSWPIVLAGLDRLGDWDPVFALRLGALGLIKGIVAKMCARDASADLVVELRKVVEALARMPWCDPPEPPR
jgi:hypothetical protein